MGIAQDKQKMLLASDNAHFSMIRFVQWNPSAYGLGCWLAGGLVDWHWGWNSEWGEGCYAVTAELRFFKMMTGLCGTLFSVVSASTLENREKQNSTQCEIGRPASRDGIR